MPAAICKGNWNRINEAGPRLLLDCVESIELPVGAANIRGGNNIRPTTVMTRRRVGVAENRVLREDSDPREIKQGENGSSTTRRIVEISTFLPIFFARINERTISPRKIKERRRKVD